MSDQPKIDDGGPAFPELGMLGSQIHGMRLLDYFAAHAPARIAEAIWRAAPKDVCSHLGIEQDAYQNPGDEIRLIAKMSWQYAEAMLAEHRRRMAGGE
jgi:hypothetical protein